MQYFVYMDVLAPLFRNKMNALSHKSTVSIMLLLWWAGLNGSAYFFCVHKKHNYIHNYIRSNSFWRYYIMPTAKIYHIYSSNNVKNTNKLTFSENIKITVFFWSCIISNHYTVLSNSYKMFHMKCIIFHASTKKQHLALCHI